MNQVGKTSGQGSNIARVIGRLTLLIKAAGDRLFRAEDERARQYGWQTTVHCGGLGRSYRDPRFSRFRSCPACRGTGIDPAEEPCDQCGGTGRITVSPSTLAGERRGS
jgi:DnaJ-class molecular chaperone